MTQTGESRKIETAIASPNFSVGLDPVIFKERKQRWLEATELMRRQKLFMINRFAKYEFTTDEDGPNTMRMILPKEVQGMVDYIDERINEAAKEIIGQGA